MEIVTTPGDITTEVIDAVVNAANEALAGGAASTVPSTGRGEADLLASCYRRCLAVADELGATSMAFPAISTGAYGYPVDGAAAVAVATLRSAATEVRLVRLVTFDDATLAAYQTRLAP
ncbi:MAG: macro domain-containing protein [Acidimicrobiales bacterium]